MPFVPLTNMESRCFRGRHPASTNLKKPGTHFSSHMIFFPACPFCLRKKRQISLPNFLKWTYQYFLVLRCLEVLGLKTFWSCINCLFLNNFLIQEAISVVNAAFLYLPNFCQGANSNKICRSSCEGHSTATVDCNKETRTTAIHSNGTPANIFCRYCKRSVEKKKRNSKFVSLCISMFQ